MLVSNLSKEDRSILYREIERHKHIPAVAVEKDWWITMCYMHFFQLNMQRIWCSKVELP